jgi:hypothetical protein
MGFSSVNGFEHFFVLIHASQLFHACPGPVLEKDCHQQSGFGEERSRVISIYQNARKKDVDADELKAVCWEMMISNDIV